MREKPIENALKKGVEKKGGVCLKILPWVFAGWPDRFLFLPGGKFYLVELKSNTGRLSPIQRFVRTKLTSLGFNTHVLNSIENVNKFLDEI